jgi:hypothetical protein
MVNIAEMKSAMAIIKYVAQKNNGSAVVVRLMLTYNC